MKNKRIVVCLKYYKGELNPFDGAALECALETGGEVTALAMAPLSVEPQLKSLTRLGVNTVLISDSLFAGSDTQATSYILSEAIKKLAPDFVFCGRQSVDGDTAQVPPMLAKRLGFSFVSKVMRIENDIFLTRAGTCIRASLHSVVAFEKVKTLRFPSIFSKARELLVWDNEFLKLSKEKCGLLGSPTRVVKSYESNVGRRDCKFVGLEKLGQIIEESLRKERVERAVKSDEKLDEIYFVGNVETVAKGIAKRTISFEIEGKTVEEIAKELQERNVKTVLWEDSERLKIVASQIAVLTGAGICADCISFRVENGKLVMTRPALGGNITADIVCESDMAFATVRTVKKDGVDVIFSVGKGGIEQIDKIKALAEKYGAEVCCSRIVADSGKLPYEKQVGLTGKTVCPKVYVAFGISGAVQHTCAIEGAGTVIALNTDKNARIFDYADYGIIAQINDL